MIIAGIVVAALLGFAWGGIRRATRARAAVRDAAPPENVAPATQAGREFTSGIPLGNAAVIPKTVEGVAPQLQPPGAAPRRVSARRPAAPIPGPDNPGSTTRKPVNRATDFPRSGSS